MESRRRGWASTTLAAASRPACGKRTSCAGRTRPSSASPNRPAKSAVSISSRGESRKSRLGSASSGKNETAPNNDDAEHTSDNGGDEDVEMKDGENIDVNQTRNGEAGGGAEVEEEDNDSDISSPPGSVHDSADDESDLSDVPADYEDNVPPSLLFPNLRRSAEAVAVTATASTQDSTRGEHGRRRLQPPADEEDE